MELRLHRNATTTPAVRRRIQTGALSGIALARRFGIMPATVYKWRKR